MKANELRQKAVGELKSEHISLLRELFNLRMQKAVGQLGKGHEMKRARRDIARLLTVIHQKMGSEA